jgi:hypothetical protein
LAARGKIGVTLAATLAAQVLAVSIVLAGPAPAPTRLEQLPAVSEDGKLVAVAIRVSDGARNNDNLGLAIIDVDSDRVVESVVIIDATKPDKPGRAQRRAAAQAVLARRVWRPLHALAVSEDPGAPERRGGTGGPYRSKLAAGQGLRVTYREPWLTVRESGRDGRELLRRRATQLSLRAGERCPGCGVCPAPLAGIAEAAVDTAARVLYLVIAYGGGSDVCWEPNETFHVIRLPP